MPTTRLQEVGSRFEAFQKNGKGYKARCPVHPDSVPSLSINEGGDGRIVLHCFAGCKTADVLNAVGLSFADLNPIKPSDKRGLVEAYDYRDEKGKLLKQAVRFEPKGFRQRAPKQGGGWKWSTGGVRNVPYRLPELVADPKRPVFVLEGEKDVDRAFREGLLATCNIGGAGKWSKDLSEFLAGRDVLVIPDNDQPGREHAEDVARKLSGVARSVKVVALPNLPEKGDLSDWLDRGHTKQELHYITKRTPEWTPTTDAPAPDDQFQPVPFSELMKKNWQLRQPVVEGVARRGETVNVIAPSKIGKSWLCCGLALCIANGKPWLGRFEVEQGKVLLIDNELHQETLTFRARTVAERMKLPVDNLDVISLRGRLIDYPGLGEKVVTALEPKAYRAIIVDSHYRMFPGGVSENDNAAVAGIYNLIDQFAERTGAAWFLIHHSSKGDQSEKTATDVGAGAGSMARAADCHLILRRHVESDAFVLDGAPRSFKPIEPVVLRWEFPLWTPDDNLNPADLRRPNDARREQSDQQGRESVTKALARGPLTSRKLREAAGMGAERLRKLINQLVESGEIGHVEIERQDCLRLSGEGIGPVGSDHQTGPPDHWSGPVLKRRTGPVPTKRHVADRSGTDGNGPPAAFVMDQHRRGLKKAAAKARKRGTPTKKPLKGDKR